MPHPPPSPPPSLPAAAPDTPRSRGGLALWAARWRIRAALALGLTAAAGRGLNRLLSRHPGDAWALATRVHWHGARGDAPQALADAEALVAVHHPGRTAADDFNLGFAREACGQVVAAEAAFRHALQRQPTLALAWLGLARVLAQQGQVDEALTALARHAELQPWAPDGRVAQVNLLMQAQRADEAQQVWQQLRGFDPRAAWGLLQQWPALAPHLAPDAPRPP